VRVIGPDREGGDQDRTLDRTSPASVPDVDDHHAVLPLRRIRDAVVDPHVVHGAVGVVVLADVARGVDVAHVEDDVLVAPAEREEVRLGREYVVDAAGEVLVVRRGDDRVGRVRQVEHDDAVAPVRSAFERDDTVAAVR
jgi:hypothetical protein